MGRLFSVPIGVLTVLNAVIWIADWFIVFVILEYSARYPAVLVLIGGLLASLGPQYLVTRSISLLDDVGGYRPKRVDDSVDISRRVWYLLAYALLALFSAGLVALIWQLAQ